MDFDRFIQRIEFLGAEPHDDLQQIESSGFQQIEQTRLPEAGERTRQVLAPLEHIPRMSTFAIGAIINYGVAKMNADNVFLNIGVWHGYTLLAGMLGNPERACIGVDNFSSFGSPSAAFIDRFNLSRSERHLFYLMDYEEYFSEYHSGLIGFYVYDGDHAYHHQMNGLRLAETFFDQGCVVLVDDTNRTAPRNATLDFIRESENEYEILLDQTTAYNGHPTFWNGIMIFRRVASRLGDGLQPGAKRVALNK